MRLGSFVEKSLGGLYDLPSLGQIPSRNSLMVPLNICRKYHVHGFLRALSNSESFMPTGSERVNVAMQSSLISFFFFFFQMNGSQ